MQLANQKQRAKVEQIREQILELDIRIDEIETGPLPVDEAVARFLHSARRRNGAVESRLHQFAEPDAPEPNLEDAQFALALHDVLLDPGALEARARAFFQRVLPESAIPTRDRTKLVAQVKAERTELELAEEREIYRLELAGVFVARRVATFGVRDVDPAILLQVWDEEAT